MNFNIFAPENIDVMKSFLTQYLGILLVCLGVLVIFVLYVCGETNSNLVNSLASLMILAGIILYVYRMKKNSKY